MHNSACSSLLLGSISEFRQRLAVTTALAVAAVFGYGNRTAYAGACVGVSGTYACSGPLNLGVDSGQVLSGAPLTVTTTAGFGIDTSASHPINDAIAIKLTGTGGLNFTDDHASVITGVDYGIRARNYSSGSISVTTNGHITASNLSGIQAFNFNNSANLTVSARDVDGLFYGINTRNEGNGGLSVTTTGQITGAVRSGIGAKNYGTDLTISAVDTSSLFWYGIHAQNFGSGALSITTTGQTTGGIVNGIEARNSSTGTDLTISASDTNGAETGIRARNYGSGALELTTNGQVTGANGGGIVAENLSGGTSLTVSASDVAGSVDGINVKNEGSGSLSVTTTGNVAGTLGNGIKARNYGTSLTVSAVDATGRINGIYARNDGSGALDVTVSGTVTSGIYGEAIRTVTTTGKSTVIALNDGASVSSASGNAITNDGGNSTTTVNTGASVAGTIRLSDGSDSLHFNGGDFSSVTEFNGGANTGSGSSDMLTFSHVAGVLDGSKAINWEQVVIGTNGEISLTSTLSADEVTVANGGLLGGDGTIAGLLTVEAGGTVGPGFSPGTLTIDGDLDVLNGAILSFELGGLTAGSGYDQLDVLGTASLEAGAVFDIISYLNFQPSDQDAFDILIADDIIGDPLSSMTFNYGFNNLNWTGAIVQDGGRETLRLTASAVPVPSSLLFALSGVVSVFSLGWIRRRRQAMVF